MFKTKRTIISLIIISLLMCNGFSTITYAEPDTIKAENVIQTLVDSISRNDWTSFADLYTNDDKREISTFLNNPENEDENLGIFNIKSAKLKEVKQIPNNFAGKLTKISQYQENFEDVEAFLVGIDCSVKKESKYFFNGVNYYLIVLGKEAGLWDVLEMSDAPLEILVPNGYGFGSTDEKDALKVVKARIKGKIINKNGAIIENNAASLQQQAGNTSIMDAGDAEHVVPSTIRVYLTNSGTVSVVDFTTYCKNVLPNEWISSWSSEALKAGALCVKMYGWYHVYHPKWPSLNADVKDTTADQVYVAGSAVSSTSAAVDSVDAQGLENSDGNIFEAQYLAGTQGVAGTQSSGKVMQWGTKYWADLGTKNYYQMTQYYYDYSDKSSGAISLFNYGGINENLAFNKTVTVTSEYTSDGWGKAKAVDGQRNSTSTSMGWTSYSNTTAEYHTESITIDLGSVNSINKVDLYPRNDTASHYGMCFPRDFTIQTSTNNSTWVTAVTQIDYAQPGNAVQSFTFTPADARYVKITGTRFRQDNYGAYLMQLAEVEVYSDNLAREKAITVSSEYASDGWGKSKAVDGLRNSTSTSMGWTSYSNVTAEYHSEWILIDLGSTNSISSVDLYPRNDTSSHYGMCFPRNFTIETSTNNSTWNPVVTQTDYTQPGNAVQSFNFTSTNARYVRITGTRLRQDNNGDYLMQLAEIEIFN